MAEDQEIGRSGSDEPSGCQPSASAVPASQSGIPNAEEVAEAAAACLKPELFESLIRNAADDFYERLLDGVQDYLVSNAGFNIGTRIEAAEAAASRSRKTVTEQRIVVARLAGALTLCRDRFREYARLHHAKGTREGTLKAAANADMANMCALALHASGIEGEAGDPKGLHPEGESPAPKGDAR